MESVNQNQNEIAKEYGAFQTDWLPGMLTFVLMFASSVGTFFLPIYLSEHLGFSGAQIGLLFSFLAAGGILAAIPSGIGNDRITSRTLIIAALVMLFIGFVLMGIVQSFVLFLSVYFIFTISSNLFRMSVDVQVLKHDKGNETGGRIGLYQAFRFGGIGIGTIVAGYLIEELGFQATLMGAGVICLLLTLPAWGLPPTHVKKVHMSDYIADFSNKKVLFFAGWLMLFATHWGAEYTSYPLFLRKEFGLSMIGMGWYMSGEFAAILLTAAIVGRRLKGNNWIRPVTIAGLALSGIGHIGMVFPPIALSFAFRALHGIGDGLIFLVFYIGIARLFKAERIGGNAGLLNFASMIGMIIGAMVFGPMGEKYGYAMPLWITGVLCLVLIVPILAASFRKNSI
jgi:MFS family permease